MNKNIKQAALVFAFCSAMPPLASAALFDYPIAVNSPPGSFFTAAVTGDFNGDNNLDVIAASRFTTNITFYAGLSNGFFAPPVKAALGTLVVTQINKGDFNGDGVLDLLLAHGVNGWSVSLGKGGGVFSAPVLNTMPLDPVSNQPYIADFAETIDLNADGFLDVVVAGGSNSHVFLGQGNAVFNAPLTTGYTAPLVGGVLLADLNADATPDVVALLYNEIAVATGVGDGTFNNSTYPTTVVANPLLDFMQPTGAIAADINGDAILDIVVSNVGRNNIGVFIGTGAPSASFNAVVYYSTTYPNSAVGREPLALAAGDFNGDGILDIATANRQDAAMSAFLGKGDGTFALPEVSFDAFSTNIVGVKAADLNGDGADDLILIRNYNLNLYLTPIPEPAPSPVVPAPAPTPTPVAAPAEPGTVATSSSGGCLLSGGAPFAYLFLMVAAVFFRHKRLRD